MKKSQFSEEQKIATLKEVRAGNTIVTTCAKHNIAVQTWHAWRRKYTTFVLESINR